MRAREIVDGEIRCPGCESRLPVAAFGVGRNGRPAGYCIDCNRRRAKEWYEANHVRALEAGSAYRREHRGELTEYFRQYNRKHAERRRAQSAEWCAKYPERVRASARANYERTKAIVIARSRAWAIANPDKARAHTRAKNVRRRGAPLTADGRAFVQLLERDPCSYCGGRAEIVIDHITALANGGDSQAENLTAACRSCNAAKHDKSLLGFLWERRSA